VIKTSANIAARKWVFSLKMTKSIQTRKNSKKGTGTRVTPARKIGRKIAGTRVELDLTQAKLVDRIAEEGHTRITKDRLGSIERGTTSILAIELLAIAIALHLDVQSLQSLLLEKYSD
jgi:hypothetical protein